MDVFRERRAKQKLENLELQRNIAEAHRISKEKSIDL